MTRCSRIGWVSCLHRRWTTTEAKALEQAMDTLIRPYGQDHRFAASDICECHRTRLGDIYEWAGRYRQVNVSKGDFPFAAATQMPALIEQVEQDVLRRWTPCKFADRAEVIRALAEATSSWC